MSEYSIRRARPGDAATLAHIWVEFGRYYAELDPVQFRVPEGSGLEEWTESRLEEERSDDEIWLVAERDGLVIGYVQAGITRPAEKAQRQILRDVGEPVLKVHALMVLDHERRRGAGTSLMQAVESWAKIRGATRAFFLMTYRESPSAVPFYAEFYAERMSYQPKMLGFWKQF